jgi:tetratricopeptide (TPR) repeat protein
LYNEQGDNKHAAEILNAVPEARRTSKVYAMLGYTYEQQKDYKSAIGSYQHALILDKDNLDALRGLAQNLASDNQTAAALEQYRMLQEADPQDAQASLRVSELYRRLGKFDLALENLKKAEALQQDSMEVAYNEVNILEAQGKYDEAAAGLQKLIARSSAPSDRHNLALFLDRLGNVYRQEGRPLLAQETYRRIVDMGGQEAARGYAGLIDSYRDQKLWADATRTAQEAVKKLPDDKGLKLALAQQLADEGKAEESVSLAKSVIKGTPEDRDALVSLSQIYARLKRWQEAEEVLNDLIKQTTRSDEQVYVRFVLGATYEREKKYDLAEQAFRQVLQQDPGSAGTLNYLGYMMADHNMHLEEALSLIKRAVELEPQNGAYLDSLGWAYFKLGKYEEAEANLRKAADKTPNDATVQDHMGELYAKTGRLKMAVTHWERALQEWNRNVPADVDQQDVARVQKKLESTKVKLAQQQH